MLDSLGVKQNEVTGTCIINYSVRQHGYQTALSC